MKTKSPRGKQPSLSSRILTITGAAILLFVLPGDGQVIVTTNTASTAFQRAQVIGDGMFASGPTFSLGLDQSPGTAGPVLPPATVPPMSAPTTLPADSALPNPTVPDGSASGFVARRAFPDLTASPARVRPTPLLDPSILVLQAPRSDVLGRYDPMKPGRDSVKDVAVQLFIPVSKPAPPGQSHDLVSGESARPWPVVAAGAASSRCWNDPGIYQPQNYLSFNW